MALTLGYERFVRSNADGTALVVSYTDTGTVVAQPLATPTTSAQTLTLTSPAKAVRISATGLNPAATTAPVFAYLCFDAPNDATRDSWLTDTNNSPRVALRVNGQAIEVGFDTATISAIGYKLSAADATARLHVEAIV